jgi:polyisoprenoid-binding protein YceI
VTDPCRCSGAASFRNYDSLGPQTKETDISIANTNSRPDQMICGTWKLDQQRSSVEFRVGHFWGLVAVRGHFTDYQGRLDLTAKPAIELTIDAASLETGNRRRDEHLRSSAFFDVENHPLVRFLSDSIDQHGDMLKVRGCLSAGGRSIPVEVDAQVRKIGGELEIKAATPAPHRELGMTYSPLGMIASRSDLCVRAHLIPARGSAA